MIILCAVNRKKKFRKICDVGKNLRMENDDTCKKGEEKRLSFVFKFQNIFVSNNLEYALKFPACKDDS